MSKKHDIYQYDETGFGKFEPSWYATVWESGGLLRIQAKGMPFNSMFAIDRRAIPQLINALKAIENDQVT